jgi:hypothetical protein
MRRHRSAVSQISCRFGTNGRGVTVELCTSMLTLIGQQGEIKKHLFEAHKDDEQLKGEMP